MLLTTCAHYSQSLAIIGHDADHPQPLLLPIKYLDAAFHHFLSNQPTLYQPLMPIMIHYQPLVTMIDHHQLLGGCKHVIVFPNISHGWFLDQCFSWG